jgi:hypothetical protein
MLLSLLLLLSFVVVVVVTAHSTIVRIWCNKCEYKKNAMMDLTYIVRTTIYLYDTMEPCTTIILLY